MANKLDLKEVIERFNYIHNGKYDYSLIKEYRNNRTKLPMICYQHGLFYQTADKHFHGSGCPKCAKNCKMNNESFKEKAHIIHGDDYIYDEVEYKDTETKVKIGCRKCGKSFWQTPHMHLHGQGCPNCYGNDTKTNEKYIAEAKEVHGDKYIYTKTKYNGAYGKIIITCPIHGDFEQIARVHLQGHGCPECSGKKKYDKEYLTEKATEVHGNKYDYSMINEIKNNRVKLPIICPKHGVFYQSIDNHVNQKQGCPKCQRSLLEEEVYNFLTENGYEFEERKHFVWLGSQHLDFYLPKYNIAIECQGIQHLMPYGSFGSKTITKEELFENVCKLDDIKNKLCAENKVNLIYYTNINCDYRYPISKSKDELLKVLNGFVISK